MLAVTCLVATIRPFAQATTLPIRLAGIDPGQFFSAASQQPSGSNALQLTLDYSRFNQVPVAPQADLLNLHIALRLLTLNPTTTGTVDRIGLLLADQFTPRPTVLGVMFDAGFQTGVADPSFNAVPREGCAIFLNAILALRGPGPLFDQEVAFTAIHEIGHIFNLWHIHTTPNLMAQSPAGSTFGPQAFFFLQPHAQFLSFADQSAFVAPGGSDFGRRGTLGPAGDSPFNGARRMPKLRIHISASHREFWSFEPVELNIRLSAETPVTLPDIIDPGYEDFDIWIEDPDGSRRAYRSTARYCLNSGRIAVAPRKPFNRDVSIWGESGGYTFKQVGVHKVWCTLRLGGRVVDSNTVELFVKPGLPRSTRYQRAKQQLTETKTSRLLFYKAGRLPLGRMDLVSEALKDFRGTPTAANIRYSLGRALVTAVENTRRSQQRKRYVTLADRALKQALDSGLLWRARQRRAQSLLDSLQG